jgi:hypothetical protein
LTQKVGDGLGHLILLGAVFDGTRGEGGGKPLGDIHHGFGPPEMKKA